jgi:tetratricopeptide (TPR) repeat protein
LTGALGIVVYEWITGKRPFAGSLSELIGQHISAPPPSIREVIPKLPPAVEEVVMKSLAKDPKERYTRVADFSIALEEACRGVPSQPPHIISTPPAQGQQLQTKVIAQAEPQPAVSSPQMGNRYPAQQGTGMTFTAALAQLEAGRYAEALAAFENVIAIDPTFHFAHNCKGLALYHLRRYPEALTALNRAIALNSRDTTAYYGKALTLEKMQRDTEALEAIEQVTQLQPTYISMWCKKGEILSRLKRYESSIAAYEQALTLDPNNADAYIGKGSVLKLLGRTQ